MFLKSVMKSITYDLRSSVQVIDFKHFFKFTPFTKGSILLKGTKI